MTMYVVFDKQITVLHHQLLHKFFFGKQWRIDKKRKVQEEYSKYFEVFRNVRLLLPAKASWS